MFKMIGSLLIIICGLVGGRLLGYKYVRRTKELQLFVNSLQMLETEIGYGRTLLPEALKRLAEITPQPHKHFFWSVYDHLHSFDGLTADQAWQKVIDNTSANFCLNTEDWEVLRQFGRALGISDDEDQVRHVKVAQKRLEQLELESREEGAKMSRLWNYIGVLGCVALVILLY